MKKILAALLLLFAVPAAAQDVPNHALPIGRGPGVIGWGTLGPCPANEAPFWLSGLSVDPSCALAVDTITLPSGEILVGSASNVAVARALSGDCSITNAGVLTCTTVNGLNPFNASNLSSGTVAAARGGAGTITGALRGNGSGVVTQAACADLSNAAASCSTDTTNAANITSGTLNAGRMPALTGDCTSTAGTVATTCQKLTLTTSTANSSKWGPWNYTVPICGNPTFNATGTTATVTISNASPAVVTWTSHGQAANMPVYFTTTGTLPAPLQPKTTYYVIAAGLTANTFEISTTPGGAAINTTSAGTGTQTAVGACILSLNLSSVVNYDTHSVFEFWFVGGGGGGCNNFGGGGAGGTVVEDVSGLPANATIDMISGAGGFGCHANASPRAATPGTSSSVAINGQIIGTATPGANSATVDGGHGGDVIGCSGFLDNSTGFCIRQAEVLKNGGDGCAFSTNGACGGTSSEGGPLNSSGGGGAEGSGGGYSNTGAFGFDGFHGRVRVRCVFGCW